MPRKARILLDNVYYHIINRGNQKQKIFLEHNDFKTYLLLLKHFKRKYAVSIIGYCLMPNHIHLIVEPKYPRMLWKFMQGLTQAYAIWFNKKYQKTGHLWQARFKSMVIQKDEYFLECVNYVEGNPARAGLVRSPAAYTWSSYRERLYGAENKLIDLPRSS